jgi:hypothetical protein
MKGNPMMSIHSVHLYVSPDGNDAWPGTVSTPSADGTNGPLATLAGARDAIRRQRATQGGVDRPVTVQVAAGFYALAETLCFRPEDSGTTDCPVRYLAAPGAAPVISGGRRILDWRETEHRGLRCWVADLPEVAAGQWYFTRLYVNDTPRWRPRMPREGFHRFTGLAGSVDSGSRWLQGPDRANFAPGDIRRWHNWSDVELVTYQLWFDTHHRFREIDETAGVIQFHAKSLGSLRDERGEFARFFVENVFEALDTPGEWYLDRISGRLYYLPLPEERLETTVIVAPRLAELVRLQGDGDRRVGHLHFENLVLAHQQWELPLDCPGFIQAAWGVPGAVILEGAEHCVFYGCTVEHVNGYGIEMLAGSTENTVAACVVHDAGGGGIKVGHESCAYSTVQGTDVPEQQDLLPIAATVADCTIRDCGHLFPSAIGIWIGNSGWNRIVHNRIFNCHYTGISCGWTWGYAPTRTVCNRIEHNHIHHINHREVLSDNGGIYTLGIQPGTVLRGNVIHDISCFGYGGWGIYPDEGSSEMRVEQNLVCGTRKAAYSTHYGRDTLVQHNIFALSERDHLSLGKRETHRSTLFRRNIVVTANGCIEGAWDPAHFTAADNLFWSLDGTPFTFGGQTLAALQEAGQHSGAAVADPLFSDAAGGDFALRPDSPAHAIGFTPFDAHVAGPRFGAKKPLDYAEYTRRFPAPDRDVPVVRTAITLLTSGAEVESDGRAVFAVTLTNVGRAAGRGSVRLSAGPTGVAGKPSVRRFTYALQPGETHTERVTLPVRRGAPAIWLDSEPSASHAVPARGLVLADAVLQWHVPVIAGVSTPEGVADALAPVCARRIACGGRTVADVKLAASEAGLLLLADIQASELRPDLEQPWCGTALELIAFHPAPAGAPVDQPLAKRQVFLVPHADGAGATRLQLHIDEGVDGVVPAPELRVSARPVAGGCELTALVPWPLLGYAVLPNQAQVELIVDSVDPVTGAIVQQTAFEQIWNGWTRLPGTIILAQNEGDGASRRD